MHQALEYVYLSLKKTQMKTDRQAGRKTDRRDVRKKQTR